MDPTLPLVLYIIVIFIIVGRCGVSKILQKIPQIPLLIYLVSLDCNIQKNSSQEIGDMTFRQLSWIIFRKNYQRLSS
jgi:hypothetical protein